MKKIELSGKNGKGLFALVDDKDFLELSKHKWHLHISGYALGRPNGVYPQITMHQFIMKSNLSFYCDHINRNKLDNRRKNLRLVTPKENSLNNGKPLHYFTIAWINKTKRFQVYNKKKYIGVYKTRKEALAAIKEFPIL